MFSTEESRKRTVYVQRRLKKKKERIMKVEANL